MRYYCLSVFEKKARAKARKEASRKRKREKELEKRRRARARKLASEKAKMEKLKKLEAEKLKKAREKERARRRKEEAHKKEIEKRRAYRKLETLRRQAEREEQKKRLHEIEVAKAKNERRKARRHEKSIKHQKELLKKRAKRYVRRKARKKRISEKKKEYYQKVLRPKRYKNRIEANDIPGRFIIVTTQDLKVRRKWYSKSWWSDALNQFNEMVEKNHTTVMCPIEEIASSGNKVRKTSFEVLLLKMVNPEVEDNISVFKDKHGKSVTVKTDNERWQIVLKEPWYHEERFIICGHNPVRDKKSTRWICENLIEKEKSVDNLKRVILWKNFLIIYWNDDFSFAIAKTQKTARRLYMLLFDKYQNDGSVIFFGYLDKQFIPMWIEKIQEKTGWERLKKKYRKQTYFSKAVASTDSRVERANPIPTTSKSTTSTDGNGSSGTE